MSEKDYQQLVKSVLISAPVERVWSALTEAASLKQWMAENVILEPKAEGRFAAWGLGTSGNDILPENAGKIVATDSGTNFTVELVLMGFTARLTLSVRAEGSGCRATADYELPQNRESLPWYLSGDHAIVLLGNLREFVETGKPCVWPGPPSEGTARVSVTVDAPASDVFASLTVPEIMNKWLSSDASVDLSVGGRYDYGWTETLPDGTKESAGPTEVLAVETDRLLRHGWHYGLESPTQVEWIIASDGGSTTVKITHSGFGDVDDVNSYVQGWAAFLVLMKALLEGKSSVE